MSKNKFRPFWSYDVLKTQDWLNDLSFKGYKLIKVNPVLRIFQFNKSESENKKHIINYDKGLDGYPIYIKDGNDYTEICYTKNFYFLEQISDEPNSVPSYNDLVSRNRKIKYIVGQMLLFQIMLYSFFILIVIIFTLGIGSVTVESIPSNEVEYTTIEIMSAIAFILVNFGYFIIQIWMIYSFFRLRVSNRKLEVFCGDGIDMSFTIPKDTILTKEEIRKLRKEKKLIKKTKVAWFYSPDKIEDWLEQMELKGFNLIRMSKIGNSFYFKTGLPRNVKYHVDFQTKKGANYFSLNKESGWKLYFTSYSRFMAISVWGQEYTELVPKYYSDHETKVKHAKKYMWTYLAVFLPAILFVVLSIGMSITLFAYANFENISTWMILSPLIMLVLVVELLFFCFKVIRYYSRVKATEL